MQRAPVSRSTVNIPRNWRASPATVKQRVLMNSPSRNLALEVASAGKVDEMKAQLFAWHKPDVTPR